MSKQMTRRKDISIAVADPLDARASIPRHKTAIRRSSYSRPVTLAQTHGLIAPGVSVLDYGCGLGEDVALLRNAGVSAEGWDPYYRPETAIGPADCVNLGYVLNVIEDPCERRQTLQRAYELARRVLIVAVRVDQALTGGAEFSDGLVTNCGSFQKIFTQAEFREYLQAALGRKPYMAGFGVAYVFKDEAVESALLAQLSIRPIRPERIDWLAEFRKDIIATRLIELTSELGRSPLPREFDGYDALSRRFGSRARVDRLVVSALNPDSLVEARERKRSDLLTFLAMLHLRGLRPPPLRALPPETQADIKLVWRSYADAVEAGREFLFQLGKPQRISEACQSSEVGKRLPTDFYVHASAEEHLPALLRVVIFAAHQVVGDVEYDVAKLTTDGRKVSFLKYKAFEEDGHPELQYSVRVHLPTASYAIRDYTESENPPILHRKEALVAADHSNFREFASLTEREEHFGLLAHPTIGFRTQWRQLLAERGLEVVGHEIVDAAATPGALAAEDGGGER